MLWFQVVTPGDEFQKHSVFLILWLYLHSLCVNLLNWNVQGLSFLTFHNGLRDIMNHIKEAHIYSNDTTINTYYIIRMNIGHFSQV